MFNYFELERVFTVLVPCRLKVFAVMGSFSKKFAMLTKPGSRVYGASNVELSVYDVPNLVDDVA